MIVFPHQKDFRAEKYSKADSLPRLKLPKMGQAIGNFAIDHSGRLLCLAQAGKINSRRDDQVGLVFLV
jgi:hypothetical protein